MYNSLYYELRTKGQIVQKGLKLKCECLCDPLLDIVSQNIVIITKIGFKVRIM